MANVTRKRTGELIQKLFLILKKSPEGIPAAHALEELAKSVVLTPHEAGFYESTGTRRFEKIVRFATVDCVKAGWLSKHKGTWALTKDGSAALDQFPDAEALYKEAVRRYQIWRSETPKDEPEIISDEDVNESASITFEQADEQAWAAIERHLLAMDPYEFQKLVASLVSAMGYHVSWISPRGKDGGVDVIAHSDPLGTVPPRIKIQVKRVADKINSDGLRSFISTVNDGDVGLYVSTGGFTKDADDLARNQERRKVTLIDAERLVDLWVQYYGKLDDEARSRLPLTPIYFLTPKS